MVSRSEDFVAMLATYSDKEPLGDDWPFKKCTSSRILSHTKSSQSHKFCYVQLQKLIKSTPKKVIRRKRGVSKAKIFKEEYEAKLEFTGGRFKLKKRLWEGYECFLEQQNAALQ